MGKLFEEALPFSFSLPMKEGFAGVDTWNAPTVQSRQSLTYRLMESIGMGGPRSPGGS